MASGGLGQITYEVLFQDNTYHWRLVDNGAVIMRSANLASAALALSGAAAAKAAALAAIPVPTPGDIVSNVTSAALAAAAAAPIVNLTAGISDDRGGPG